VSFADDDLQRREFLQSLIRSVRHHDLDYYLSESARPAIDGHDAERVKEQIRAEIRRWEY